MHRPRTPVVTDLQQTLRTLQLKIAGLERENHHYRNRLKAICNCHRTQMKCYLCSACLHAAFDDEEFPLAVGERRT